MERTEGETGLNKKAVIIALVIVLPLAGYGYTYL